MPSTKIAALFLLTALSACPRSSQHPDAGTDMAVVDMHDAANAEGDAFNIYPGSDTCPASPGDCGCIGTARRCDTCDDRCPEFSACSGDVPLCLGQDGDDFTDTCRLAFDGEDPGGWFCASGRPCLVSDVTTGTVEVPFTGPCVSVATCLELATADPEPEYLTATCRWSMGEPVDGPPPPSECPSLEGPASACGGACGDTLCPEVDAGLSSRDQLSCVGVSGGRGYGVCSFGRELCSELSASGNSATLVECEAALGENCACLVLDPQPDAASGEVGFPTGRSTCLAYAGAFDSARCVSALWTSL